MFGAKTENMKDNGKTIKCMVSARQNGLMAENIKVNTWTIRNMEQEHFIGPMAGNIMDLGKMGSNTAEDNII
jgi:hypothetical protein